jgi:hypothetical protein
VADLHPCTEQDFRALCAADHHGYSPRCPRCAVRVGVGDLINLGADPCCRECADRDLLDVLLAAVERESHFPDRYGDWGYETRLRRDVIFARNSEEWLAVTRRLAELCPDNVGIKESYRIAIWREVSDG